MIGDLICGVLALVVIFGLLYLVGLFTGALGVDSKSN